MTDTSVGAPSEQTVGLAARLRSATDDAHRAAENATFIAELMSGQLDADAFARLTGQLLFIYEALESVADDLVDDPIAGPVIDERLRRAPKLRADLAALGVDVDGVTALPAAAEYAAAIEDTRTDPARFVAHHYTRYLGDLSGGQVVAHRMREHYGLGADALSFYDFDIDKLKRYKDAYRERLNGLDLDEPATQRAVAEAVAAFGYNQALFGALGT